MTISADKQTGAEKPKRGRKPKAQKDPIELPEPESKIIESKKSKARASEEAKLTKFCKWETVRIHRSKILPAKYNPRIMTASAEVGLRDSLTKFGIVDDPVWNEFNGILIAGHQRLKQIDLAEGHLNYLIDVKRVWIEDPVVEKSLNIRLNNPNEQGEYDAAKLIEMFANKEIDLGMTGLGIADLDMMGMEQGLSTDYLDSIFGADGLSNVNAAASTISELMDQSDEIRKREPRRNVEDLQHGEREDGSDMPGDDDGGEEYYGQEDDGEGDQNHTANRGTQSATDIELIKSRRALSQNMLDAREVDYYVVLTFINNEQCSEFCKAIGIKPGSKIADGVKIAKLFDIHLPDGNQSQHGDDEE